MNTQQCDRHVRQLRGGQKMRELMRERAENPLACVSARRFIDAVYKMLGWEPLVKPKDSEIIKRRNEAWKQLMLMYPNDDDEETESDDDDDEETESVMYPKHLPMIFGTELPNVTKSCEEATKRYAFVSKFLRGGGKRGDIDDGEETESDNDEETESDDGEETEFDMRKIQLPTILKGNELPDAAKSCEESTKRRTVALAFSRSGGQDDCEETESDDDDDEETESDNDANTEVPKTSTFYLARPIPVRQWSPSHKRKFDRTLQSPTATRRALRRKTGEATRRHPRHYGVPREKTYYAEKQYRQQQQQKQRQQQQPDESESIHLVGPAKSFSDLRPQPRPQPQQTTNTEPDTPTVPSPSKTLNRQSDPSQLILLNIRNCLMSIDEKLGRILNTHTPSPSSPTSSPDPPTKTTPPSPSSPDYVPISPSSPYMPESPPSQYYVPESPPSQCIQESPPSSPYYVPMTPPSPYAPESPPSTETPPRPPPVQIPAPKSLATIPTHTPDSVTL